MRNRGSWRARMRRCDGAAIVEFTLMLPLLFSLLAGVSEFGRALYHHHVIEMALRNATRYLSRVPDPAAEADTARNLAAYGTPDASGSPLVSYWTSDTYGTITIEGPTMRTVTYTDSGGNPVSFEMPVIRMEAAVPYEDLGFLSLILSNPLQLIAEHEEVHFGD